MHMQNLCKYGLVLYIFLLPVNQAVAAPATVEALKAELADLRQRYNQQGAQLRDLAVKIGQLEAAQQGAAAPATTPPAPQTADAATRPPATTTASAEPWGVKPLKKKADASRAAEDVAYQAGALFNRKFTLEPGFTYSRFDRKQLILNGFLALDAFFLGTLSVDSVEADILTFDLTGRYGLTERLQVDVNIPFLYRNSTYQSGGAGGNALAVSETEVDLNFKLGDISAGVFYQLFNETRGRPDIVWNMRVKGPTGSNPYGTKLVTAPDNTNLITPSSLPSGNGVWALTTGLSFLKTIDPAIVFGNIGYTYNFEESFSDISSDASTVTPGEIDLGDSLQLGLGVAFALNERMSLSMSYSQSFVDESRTRVTGEDWVTIVGSDALISRFNVGMTYGLGPRISLVTTLGIGLTPDAPDLVLSFKLPYTF